jgi:hypothetical protein
MVDRRLFLAGAAGAAIAPALAAEDIALQVIELRQYTLKGGTRATFTRLFEREFVVPQNAVGAHVLGVFRDLDDPDRFVWMRGFADMAARKTALESFYFGPVWKAHRDEANGMIIDSDNVLLLRPLAGGDALDPERLGGHGVIRIAIHRLRDVEPAAFATFFRNVMKPRIEKAGARVLVTFATEGAANSFPRLPVREHDPVFAWVTRFPDEAAERVFSARLATTGGWRDGIADALLPALMQKPELLHLTPAAPVAR